MSPSFHVFRGLAWLIPSVLLAPRLLQAVDVTGKLIFVDAAPDSTPVEMLPIDIHSLATGVEFSARPDRLGKFILKNVMPGPYRLHLTMPARIRSFELGSQLTDPLNFEIPTRGEITLGIVLSLASSDLLVKVIGLPPASEVVAILAPSDPMLTLQESCILNKLSSNETHFQFFPPGKYRLFIVDARFQMAVAKYGPRLPTFLNSDAMIVDALVESSQTTVTAHYIEQHVVQEAVREADASK